MDQEIKNTIAAAIVTADGQRVPEGYADKNGYRDDGVSDWGAFLTEQVLYDLNDNGFVIVRSTVSSSPTGAEK